MEYGDHGVAYCRDVATENLTDCFVSTLRTMCTGLRPVFLLAHTRHCYLTWA